MLAGAFSLSNPVLAFKWLSRHMLVRYATALFHAPLEHCARRWAVQGVGNPAHFFGATDMSANNTTSVEQAITATQVPDGQRLDFLPRHFGRLMMQVESKIYSRFQQLCPDYKGGYWEFFDISNGGCYLAPRSQEQYRIVQPNNDFSEVVCADAAGIIITLYALCELAFDYRDDEVFGERFHQLRDFAATHRERTLIFRATD